MEAEPVQVRGAPVAVRRRGTGPALIYLHDEFVELDTLDGHDPADYVVLPPEDRPTLAPAPGRR